MSRPSPTRAVRALALPCLVFLALTVTACSHWVPPDSHTSQVFQVDLDASPALALAVWDDREDVVRGDRDPRWIALQRSLYGIPFGQQTKSGRPLADDMATLVRASLEDSGVDVEVVTVAVGSDREDAVKALAATGRQRLVLLRLDEWYNDAFLQSTLHYDVLLEVLDAGGTALAEASLAGEDDLGKKERAGRKDPNDATADILRTLLTRQRVVAALAGSGMATAEAGDGGDPAESSESCTVKQIVQMRDSGLSEGQIKAACGEAG